VSARTKILMVLVVLVLSGCSSDAPHWSAQPQTDPAVVQLGTGFASATVDVNEIIENGGQYLPDERPEAVAELIERYASP